MLLLLLTLFNVALAWGPQAHERVAADAERQLSPQAQAELTTLTPLPLSALANLADQHKATPGWRWSKPLHFINVPPRAQAFEPARDCPQQLCTTAAVQHFAHRLAMDTDPAARLDALQFLVHLVADLHQPLHVSYTRDRGGNAHALWLNGEATDLHTLWDDQLPTLARGHLVTQAPTGGSPEDWAAESLQLTRSLVYAAPAGAAVSEQYLSRATPVVAERLHSASGRLAAVLELSLTGGALPFDDPLAGGAYVRDPDSEQLLRRSALAAVGLLLMVFGLGLLIVKGLRTPWMLARLGRVPQGLARLTAHPGLLACALGGLLLTVSADVALPLVYRYAFDHVIPSPSVRGFVLLAASVSGAVAAVTSGWLLAGWSLSRLGEALQRRLRVQMFDRLLHVPLHALHDLQPTELMSRFGVDLLTLERFLARDLQRLGRSVVQILALVSLMAWLEWRLTLLFLVLLPLASLFSRRLAARSRGAERQKDQAEQAALQVVQELLDGMPILRAFGLERTWRDRFVQRSTLALRGLREQTWLTVMIPGASTITVVALTVAVLYVGSVIASQGALTTGGLTALFTAFMQLGGALVRLSSAVPSAVAALGAWGRVAGVLDLPGEGHSMDLAPAPLATGVALKDVSFAFGDGPRVLEGVTLTLPVGSRTAIVGPSGSGKSTLLWLLQQHASPDQGQVLWDGQDMGQQPPGAFRRSMGLVPQRATLFNDTARENIRLGRPGASDAQVERAARAAAVHSVLLALPQGYDTLLGPGGVELSGGQAQRVAIARALLREPALLLLDEATSALDPGTAARVRGALDGLSAHTTTVSVTHDLASVRHFEQIVVMHQGRVAGQGTHAQLLERCPLYCELLSSQTGLTVAPDGRDAEADPERLSKIPVFNGLPSSLLSELAQHAATETFEDGQVVVHQGDPGDRMYLIAYGRLEARVHGQDGQVVSVSSCGVGDHVGEIALLRDCPRTATLVAVGFCVLLSVRRLVFLELLSRDPGLGEQVRGTATVRLGGVGEVEVNRMGWR